MPEWSALPRELIDASLAYLPLRDRMYLSRTESQRTLTSVAYRRAFVLYWFPPHILDVLGGVDKCVRDYGFFKGTRAIVGGTDYVDRVRLCDLPGPRAPVYLTVDPFRRPLAVLRYWCATRPGALPLADDEEDDERIDNSFPSYVRTIRKHAKIPQEVAVALFQRYTDSPSTWCFGTCYGLERMPGDTRASADALAKVKRMLEGKTVHVGHEDWLNLQLERPAVPPPTPSPNRVDAGRGETAPNECV